MYYPSLFDSFFAPTRVIVVSEERLQAAERKAKQEQIEAVEVRINDLTKYRDELTNQLKELTPTKSGKDLDQLDGAQCDV
jgi:phosphopantetheine adenylyltransferase